jgi:hypothetical protein
MLMGMRAAVLLLLVLGACSFDRNALAPSVASDASFDSAVMDALTLRDSTPPADSDVPDRTVDDSSVPRDTAMPPADGGGDIFFESRGAHSPDDFRLSPEITIMGENIGSFSCGPRGIALVDRSELLEDVEIQGRVYFEELCGSESHATLIGRVENPSLSCSTMANYFCRISADRDNMRYGRSDDRCNGNDYDNGDIGTVRTGQWYLMRLQIVGSRVTCTVAAEGGAWSYTRIYDDPGTPHGPGHVGFIIDDATAYFDDIVVRRL